LDGNFHIFELVEVDLSDHLAVVLIAVGLCVDKLGGMAGIGAETGLAVGDVEAVEIPGDEVAYFIGKNFIPGHPFRILEARAQDDVAVVFLNGLYEASDVSRIMLAITIQRNDDIGTEELGCLDAGFGGGTFAAIETMTQGDDPGGFGFFKGSILAAIVHNDDVLVSGSADFGDNGLNNGRLMVSRNDDECLFLAFHREIIALFRKKCNKMNTPRGKPRGIFDKFVFDTRRKRRGIRP